MRKLKEIEDKIEYLRQNTNDSLCNNEDSFFLKQIAKVSKQIDDVLNEYRALKKEAL